MSAREGASPRAVRRRSSSSTRILDSMRTLADAEAVQPNAAEGFEYEADVQTPHFSDVTAARSSRRRSSVASQESDNDAMALIVADPALWREFQGRLKQTGNVTGAKANTKEVLRSFVKEKGLLQGEPSEEEEKDDYSASAEQQAPRGGRRPSLLAAFGSSTGSLLFSSNDSLADRFKQEGGHKAGQPAGPSTTAGMLRAARRRSSMLSNAGGDGQGATAHRRSSLISLGSVGRRRSSIMSHLSNSSLGYDDVPEENEEGEPRNGGTLALATSLVAALTVKQETEAKSSPSLCVVRDQQ